jgi:hypothetical protein
MMLKAAPTSNALIKSLVYLLMPITTPLYRTGRKLHDQEASKTCAFFRSSTTLPASPKGFIMLLPYLPTGPTAAIVGGFLLHLVMGT